MAAFNKYDQFAEDVGLAVHNLNSDALYIALTNTAPTPATDAILGDITEITPGNGYVAGGNVVASNAYSETGGVGTLTGTDVTFTASGGTMATFQYCVLYNTTPSSPLDPLIAYYNYGSGVSLQDGNSFTVNFGASILTIT